MKGLPFGAVQLQLRVRQRQRRRQVALRKPGPVDARPHCDGVGVHSATQHFTRRPQHAVVLRLAHGVDGFPQVGFQLDEARQCGLRRAHPRAVQVHQPLPEVHRLGAGEGRLDGVHSRDAVSDVEARRGQVVKLVAGLA